MCLSCEDIVRQSCAMLPRWRIFNDFLCPVFSSSHVQHVSHLQPKFALRKEGKEDGVYIAPLSMHAYSQSAQAWITQFYLQTTPCLPFHRKCSPDGATTTEAADIQLQLTTHLSTPKG